jgi:hypothetical protein
VTECEDWYPTLAEPATPPVRRRRSVMGTILEYDDPLIAILAKAVMDCLRLRELPKA